MADTYKILIADDEPNARELLRRIVERDGECMVVGEAASGDAAVEAIDREEPDIVLLDVQMPGMDGFDVVARVGPEDMPVVIFVTAFDDFALRAFEVHALDYVLKPFDDDRLVASLARAKAAVAQRRIGELAQRMAGLLNTRNAPNADAINVEAGGSDAPLERIVVKTGDRVHIVPVERIDWIEATGNYAKLHVGKETYTLRISMQDLESRLNARRFARIHRSTLVNIDRVRELQEYFRGEYIVVLNDGTKLKLSRARRGRLEQLLGQSF